MSGLQPTSPRLRLSTEDARTRPDVLGKRKADGEPETGEDTAGMWASFASECAGF